MQFSILISALTSLCFVSALKQSPKDQSVELGLKPAIDKAGYPEGHLVCTDYYTACATECAPNLEPMMMLSQVNLLIQAGLYTKLYGYVDQSMAVGQTFDGQTPPTPNPFVDLRGACTYIQFLSDLIGETGSWTQTMAAMLVQNAGTALIQSEVTLVDGAANQYNLQIVYGLVRNACGNWVIATIYDVVTPVVTKKFPK